MKIFSLLKRQSTVDGFITYALFVLEICSKEAIRLLPAILMLAGLFYLSRGFTNRKGVSSIIYLCIYCFCVLMYMK